jgi:sugar phosphate isomerase/epimerase
MTSVFYQYDLMDAVIDIRDLVVHTHVHDNFGRAVHHYEKIQTHQLPFGRGDSHMPPGFGDLPIKKIIKTLLPDYKGMFMLELRSRYFNDIKESCNKIKSIVDQCF